MRKLIGLFLLALSQLVYGQKQSFEGCNFSPMIVMAEKVPVFGETEEALQKYFDDYFAQAGVAETTNGKAVVQVIFNTSGEPCCKGIVNSTLDADIDLKIHDGINAMPAWSPATQGGKAWNFSTIIQFEFANGTAKVKYQKMGSPINTANKKETGGTTVEEGLSKIESFTKLILYNQQLTELDPRVGQLVNLKQIHAGANLFETLPAEIGALQNLENLEVYKNKLQSVPPEIGNLKKLKFLLLDNNELTTLPEEIKNLQSLVYLKLDNNRFSAAEQARIKSLLPRCSIQF